MTDALENHEGTVSIGGRTITNLRSVDDIDGWAGEEEELAKLVERPQPTTRRSVQSDGEDGEQPIDVGLRIQRFNSLGAVRLKK